ncbi:MAG: Tm-1-like ATP-binding domain-containing protein [Chloroflexia bacterium]|nr:Tm-1-like ATP-binding domain-containing protein [Chloroflexia bacterium]
MTTVILLGTLDTKGEEYGFVRDRLRGAGIDTLVIDAGILDIPRLAPDVTREEVAAAANADIATLVRDRDRGAAIDIMLNGATAIVQRLVAEREVHGIFGMGGSGGSTLVSGVMRELPVGFPKLLVSTVASGDTRPYVGTSDIAMMSSIVDIAGINQLSELILANAAGAIGGMARAHETFVPSGARKPVIGATMFGVTTPCTTVARERLEALGYEVLVFHATGIGGDTMESLIRGGVITGVLDTTTTELADTLVGGALPSGPERLEIAGSLGLPQIVSLGALDMVNFGPIESVPERFRDRHLFRHNASITLMRTTREENAELGRIIAGKLNGATGPVALFIPLRGVSAIDIEGQAFHDPEADAALFDALRSELDGRVKVVEVDTDINDPAFAIAMADELDRLYKEWSAARDVVV